MKKIEKFIRKSVVYEYDPSKGKEYEKKKELIKKITDLFGEGCIESKWVQREYAAGLEPITFRAPNLIILNRGDVKLVLYFHYSKEIGFYGFDKNLINDVIEYINKNSSEKIFFYLLFILDVPDERVEYFCVPIFFIKNIESGISVTKDKGTIGSGYRINLGLIKNRYHLKLKNGRYEDISEFKIEISELFNQTLMMRYNEEKIKQESTLRDKQELLRKFNRQ